ncbi:MAG TPA: hypothetical protein VGU01_13370 [Sphingomicrobium sp.]|nr:hypothetical protein [Sphingomicrobium sp.]
MRKLIYLPSLALLAAAAPVSSNPPPVTSQIAPADVQPAVNLPTGGGATARSVAAEDKKICRQLPSSNSRLPNRACLTAKEWRQVEDDLSR